MSTARSKYSIAPYVSPRSARMHAHLVRVFGAAGTFVDHAAQHGLGFGELALSAKLAGPAHGRLDLVVAELGRFGKAASACSCRSSAERASA